jgi:general stress protein 26
MEHKDAVRNLVSRDAVKKLQDLVKHNGICLFTTNLSERPLQTRPMSTQEVDDQGNLWFLSSKTSHKNLEVENDPAVQLFYSSKGDYEFLSVYGRAEIYTDQKTVDDKWSPVAKAWFQEGKKDPDVTVIKVIPEDVYYWDTKNNKVVSLVKIMASLVSGTTMDDGVEGELRMR